MTITKTLTAKIAATVAGVAMVLAFAFSFAVPAQAQLSQTQIQAIISLLQSFGADSTTIANVQASLTGGTPSVPSTPSQGGASACYNFTRDLTLGATGADVMELQKFLNANGAQVAASGAGSPGNESQTFGPLTRSALATWQAANGVSPSSGYFGPLTRAAVAAKCSATPGTPGTPTTPAPGSGLSVMAATQPQNAIAPQNASRVPFTRFTLTAGNDGPVTVNSVTVQRVGLGSNGAFSGVVLIDQDGNQIGNSRTLNSADQANIGASMTIPAGQSRTFTVAANMNSQLAAFAGQVPAFAVVAVNTNASVAGSLPITGAYHTINATLNVGTVTLQTSNAFATNAASTREIGTTGYRFTGFSLVAGGQEDLRLRSVAFNQTGNASTANDLANIQIVVDGTAYPAIVHSDGRMVSANLGSGVLIPEGNNVEVYVRADIVGGNASGRTVIFDVDKNTDIYLEGATYGYGVSPAIGGVAVPGNRNGLTITNGTPYLHAAQVTVSGAAVTSINNATSVPSQNIAINVQNQPLGGFMTDFRGEAVTVQQMTFNVATSTGAGLGTSGQLQNVTIVDQNGAVVAGPVDSTGTGITRTLTFSDSVTFPIGQRTYTIRGRVPTGTANNTGIRLDTTPSAWSNPRGELTGDVVTGLPGNFLMNRMTVQAGTLAVSVAPSPAAQTIVSGGSSVLMANFQLNAQDSGEDVRVSSIPMQMAFSGGNALSTHLSSCQLFDGNMSLTTGGNTVNPTGTSPASATFILDNPLTVAKGSVKTLGVRCNVSSAVTGGQFAWNVNAAFGVAGIGSGSTFNTTGTSSGPVLAIGTGSVSVTTDAGSPSYFMAVAGSTEVTVGAFRLSATNEAVRLTKLGLNRAQGSNASVQKVSLYDGATKIGEAIFTGTTATSTLMGNGLEIPQNGERTITVKADFSAIGVGQPLTESGTQFAVNYLNAEVVGVSSGTVQNLGAGAGSTAVAGVRIFRSAPTFALGSGLGSTGLVDGKLIRFAITADAARNIGLREFNFNIATSTATVTNLELRAFNDASYSNAISGQGTGGLIGSAVATVPANGNIAVNAATNPIQVAAGQTVYFELTGSVAGVQAGSTVTTRLLGNTAYQGAVQETAITANGGGVSWSPNSTTTSSFTTNDWFNVFGANGLPGSGIVQTRSQ